MQLEPGVIKVEFPTSFSPAALERFERREQTAATAAMRSFFNPRSVAVIGASRTPGSIGSAVFRNLIVEGFNGPVYPINPKADVVHSVAAYPNVLDAPGPVDLAVIVVPARLVIDIARDCGQKGVKALVIISAGFAETGEEGIERQRQLMSVCRATGMRVIGPNCMGIMNTDPDVKLDASFAPLFPPRGRVGFSSQSGALGLAVIDYARQLGLGMSTFVSVGNKADISGNDLINYWETDPDTDLVLLYLESFGNPRKFSRICQRVGKKKPIVAVKSGRSSAGARYGLPHRCPDCGLRRDRRRSLHAGRGHSDRHLERVVRRRCAARKPTSARGAARCDNHECRRPRNSLRGRVRCERPRRGASATKGPHQARRVPSGGGIDDESGGHDRERFRRRLQTGDTDRRGK
jgi:acetate---CoA ligase (ADP-forming)